MTEKEVMSGKGYLHEKARLGRALLAWRERNKLLDDLRDIETVKEQFDVIERISAVSHYAWIPLGRTLYMGLAAGDFIEIVEETPNYFEVRAVEHCELRLIGGASTRAAALALADAWLAQQGRAHYFMYRDRPWRERAPSPAQVSKAHILTGLPREFLRQLKSGQVSDLIATAYALTSPAPDSVEIAAADSARTTLTAEESRPDIPFHTWQFQLNFA